MKYSILGTQFETVQRDLTLQPILVEQILIILISTEENSMTDSGGSGKGGICFLYLVFR